MFHLMIALPVLVLSWLFALFGMFLLVLPFCAGALFQTLFMLLGGGKWLIRSPALFGLLCLLLSLISLNSMVSVLAILLYWGAYFCWLLLVWLVVKKLTELHASRKERK